MHIVHNDGTEADIAPGDAYVIEPGHDAWVVGVRRSLDLRLERVIGVRATEGKRTLRPQRAMP